MAAREKLNIIICEVFDDAEIKIHPAMTAKEIDGWDSISDVNLIEAVEGGLDIHFVQKEFLIFKKMGNLLNCIEKNLPINFDLR